MRIGIVSTWFERGAALVSRQLVEALTGAGHECFVYARGERYAVGCPRWDLDYVHWGKRLHWMGSGKIDRPDFEAWLDRNAIEAVLFNEQRWWKPIKWVKQRGLLAAAYIDYYTEENIEAFAAYDLLICNTRRHFSAFAWHPGAHFVPWGTDVSVFEPTSRPDRPITFFHSCGWDTYRKGTDLVLKAFSALPNDLDCRLVVHSQAPISLPGLDNPRVELRVETVQAPGLYHLGDVYVYPSRLEGIGLTICEAVSSGLPTIVTDEAPMSEFVSHGQTGWTVPVRRRFQRNDGYYWRLAEADVPTLISTMAKIAAMPINSLIEMQRRARARAETEFNWKDNASTIGALFEQSKPIQLSSDQRFCLERADLDAPWGRFDKLIELPAVASAISGAMMAWRRMRQPQLYRLADNQR